MTFTTKTRIEADHLARILRGTYGLDGWKVSVISPLFKGDGYTITVG